MGDDQRTIASYRDLLVWKKGISLVKTVYQVSQKFPPAEQFGLTAQVRRAAVSVPSNMAEGQARHTTGEFIHSLSHAEGSLAEIDTQLVIAVELGFCHSKDVQPAFDAIIELGKMLSTLQRKLREKLK